MLKNLSVILSVFSVLIGLSNSVTLNQNGGTMKIHVRLSDQQAKGSFSDFHRTCSGMMLRFAFHEGNLLVGCPNMGADKFYLIETVTKVILYPALSIANKAVTLTKGVALKGDKAGFVQGLTGNPLSFIVVSDCLGTPANHQQFVMNYFHGNDPSKFNFEFLNVIATGKDIALSASFNLSNNIPICGEELSAEDAGKLAMRIRNKTDLLVPSFDEVVENDPETGDEQARYYIMSWTLKGVSRRLVV